MTALEANSPSRDPVCALATPYFHRVKQMVPPDKSKTRKSLLRTKIKLIFSSNRKNIARKGLYRRKDAWNVRSSISSFYYYFFLVAKLHFGQHSVRNLMEESTVLRSSPSFPMLACNIFLFKSFNVGPLSSEAIAGSRITYFFSRNVTSLGALL